MTRGRGRGKGRTVTKPQTSLPVQSSMDNSKEKTFNTRHVQTVAVSYDKKGTQTEQTIESLDCLELENCNMKNIKDQLECEIESIKIIHVDELAKLHREIDEMKQKNDVLNKKLNLTTEIVQKIGNLKRENVELKEKLKSLEECLLVQDKFKSEIVTLRGELEANKQALEELDGLKEKNYTLEKDLESTERAIEYIKVNLITEITEITLNNKKEDIGEIFMADQEFADNFDLANPLAERKMNNTGSMPKSNNNQGQQYNSNRNNRFRSIRNRPKPHTNQPSASDRRIPPEYFSNQNNQSFMGNQNNYRSRISNFDYVKNSRPYQKYNRYNR